MSASTPLFLHLVVYFNINLSLSTLNKLVLEKIPTPWLLTCLHTLFTYVGCSVYLRNRPGSSLLRTSQKLDTSEYLTLLCFSCLFTINIAMSNVALAHVSLAFHQVARSTGPIFTVIIYGVWLKKVYSPAMYFSVIATSFGVGLATYGDYSCTVKGFWLSFLGMFLATIKTIATNKLLTGNLKLHPFELLRRMCPLAVIQSLICAYLAGELDIARNILLRPNQLQLTSNPITSTTITMILVDNLLAFAQNLSSFHTNKLAGALTIAIVANLKQICAIVLSLVMFKTPKITSIGIIGIIVVVSSTMHYSWLEVAERKKEQKKVKEDDNDDDDGGGIMEKPMPRDVRRLV